LIFGLRVLGRRQLNNTKYKKDFEYMGWH